MWKSIILTLLVILVCCTHQNVSAQSPGDSLLATFATIPNDTQRLDSMIHVAFELGFSDPVLGLGLAKEAEENAKLKAFKKQQARAQLTIGTIYFNQGIRDFSMDFFLKAMRLSDSIDFVAGRASAWNNIGSIQTTEGAHEEALVSFGNAKRDFDALSENRNALAVMTNFGAIYLALDRFDEAILVCDSILPELERLEDYFGMGIVYGNLAGAYSKKEEYEQALKYFDLAIEYALKADDVYGIAEQNILRGGLQAEMGDFGAARESVNKGIESAIGLEAMDIVAIGYNQLSVIAKQQGDYVNALFWLEKGIAVKDSLKSAERDEALANFKAIYEVESKDAQIDLLSKDSEVQAANIAKSRYLLGLLALFVIAMAVILMVYIRSNRSRKQANNELKAKNIQILAQNQEMEGLLQIVAHDLKAPLSKVSGLILAVEEGENLLPNQLQMLEMTKKTLQGAEVLVKNLVEAGEVDQSPKQVSKTSLQVEDLVQAQIQSFLPAAQKKQIKLSTKLADDLGTIQSHESYLNRILENLISNALKFSKPNTEVVLAVEKTATRIRFAVKDQGLGIGPEDQKRLFRKFQRLTARPTAGETSSGLGLSIVKSLVERLGGKIEVNSTLNVGTTFVVELPLD